MNQHDYWRECIETSLEDMEIGGILNKDQLDRLAADVESSHENIGLAFYQPPSRPSVSQDDHRQTVANLKKEIADLERQIECYRQSVANRRNVPIQDVELDRYGNVTYGKAFR